ncbi:carboxypeptidase regulatory-like domain-containing protein [Paludisphaera soli]|uniref:carboxypeptidase regulatory-like domain-containing protein n=1 Tax=Paludisphaera soli TaxID=2712865 RepID=UPI0013EA6596|nr:carboxypeptidase regulatory-like domain-containing protein [Paludisphaera soli]
MVSLRRALLRASAPLLLLAACASGCGEADPSRVPLVPATGRVTVGGEPAADLEVRFRPADDPESLDALVPFARTDAEGGYVLGTYEEGDGAPAGRYKVTLFWPDRPPGPERADDLLGGTYATVARTTLEATVPDGGGEIATIDVPKPAATKPKPPPRKNRQPIDIDGR